MFDRLHHMQLAMPRGAEATARAFFAGVLGMPEIDKPPAALIGAPAAGWPG
jgi:catechol 2,3-dioxygenase-like lactoylglutathione lyase family enzyme